MKTMNFPVHTMTLASGETLTYTYRREYRKWGFKIGTHTMIVPCHGSEQAHKVANIIAGSVKRCGEVDNLARKNIDRVVGV